METFLKDIVKIDLYVDVIMTRLNKFGYYTDGEVKVKETIKKDLISIVHANLKDLHIKQAVLKAYDQHIDDDEYDNMLISIKRKLFKRSKEIGTIEVTDKMIVSK